MKFVMDERHKTGCIISYCMILLLGIIAIAITYFSSLHKAAIPIILETVIFFGLFTTVGFATNYAVLSIVDDGIIIKTLFKSYDVNFAEVVGFERCAYNNTTLVKCYRIITRSEKISWRYNKITNQKLINLIEGGFFDEKLKK